MELENSVDTPNLLLWHGSRVSNFVGILSQGLRIAPPEAPVSGYMFGKVSRLFLKTSNLQRVFTSPMYLQSQLDIADLDTAEFHCYFYVK